MATKKVTIEVEVPEELARVIEKTPWLKKIIAREGIEGLRRRMELQAQLDLLTPEIQITEEEIMEIDRKIKKALARRLQNELPQNNS